MLTVTCLVCFTAMSAMTLAAGLVVRDVATSRRARMNHRLGLDRSEPIGPQEFSPSAPSTSRLDRAFVDLVEQSGSALTPPTAMAVMLGLAVVGCAIPLVLLENLLAAAGGLALAVVVPLVWWMIRRAIRRAKMRKQLADALDLTADAIRAGRSLEQAATMVSQQAPQPLAGEFDWCASQLRLGQSPTVVLERMTRRVPIPEFCMFATAALVHRHTGGNLPLLIERMAGASRDRQQVRGHVQAATAGSRLSALGLLVASIVGVALLSWMEPEYLRTFLTYRLGPTLLITAGVLQLVGIVWVSRILKIEY